MKKIPKKSIIVKPDPVIIKIDPLSSDMDIVMPRIQYTVIATPDVESKFTGRVTPIPTVLLFLLSHMELKLIYVVLEDSYRYGKCDCTVKDFAIRLNTSMGCVASVLHRLRKKGLLLETANSGTRARGKMRTLNFKTIQHLDDLVDDEDPRIYSRIREATKKTSIENLTKEDIRNAYDKYVLPPGHDPEEEEEYD